MLLVLIFLFLFPPHSPPYSPYPPTHSYTHPIIQIFQYIPPPSTPTLNIILSSSTTIIIPFIPIISIFPIFLHIYYPHHLIPSLSYYHSYHTYYHNYYHLLSILSIYIHHHSIIFSFYHILSYSITYYHTFIHTFIISLIHTIIYYIYHYYYHYYHIYYTINNIFTPSSSLNISPYTYHLTILYSIYHILSILLL